MLNGKFLLTLIGSIIAVLAISKSDMTSPVVENWWNSIQFSAAAVPAAMNARGQKTALGGNFFNPRAFSQSADMMGHSSRFVSNPSFQAMISPRMSGNLQYGANIRYNMPSREHQGVPSHPLEFGKMAKKNVTKENYSDAEPGLSCNRQNQNVQNLNKNNDYALPAGYTNGNYNDVYNTLTDGNGNPAPVVSSPCTDAYDDSILPIGTMTTTDADGNEEQVVVVNDLHTVNMKSRNVQGADFIRGDLPITPCQSGWFSVYPTLNTDLRAGAMQVLNGDGESNAQLMQLMLSSTGGTKATFGGVNLRDQNTNLTNSMRSFLSQGQNTVEVSAFP
jgi:hypothetical protein